MPGEMDREDWIGRMGLGDGPSGRSWLLDTGSLMLHRRDCGLTIDRKYPAALNLTHKAPASVITGCQSATIKYDGCLMVPHAVRMQWRAATGIGASKHSPGQGLS